MIKRTIGVLGVVLVTAFSAVALATSAHATDAVTLTATIKSTPDDGCPTWARSTFTRTTTIAVVEGGKYKVTIKDEGTFVTQVAAKSPAGAVDIAAAVTGTIVGSGEFTVAGVPLGAEALDALDGRTFDNSAYPCKADVPAERTTGKWPLQFFAEGAETSGIDPWTWVYKTGCEERTESSTAQAVGDITGKKCPEPTPTVTSEPTPTATVGPEPSTSATSAAPGVGGGGGLPVTGSSVPVVVAVAVALIAMGGVLFVVTRKRRTRYTA
jgi:LPXTG-motif cell wall-anchored protein